jgi:hypothetical protein
MANGSLGIKMNQSVTLRALIIIFTNIVIIKVHIFLRFEINTLKKKINSFTFLNNKFIKTILIVNKFNTTFKFFNQRKMISYIQR